MSDYIHWRENMDMQYLRSENLAPGEKRVLTIDYIAKETMPRIQGKNTDEHQNVAHFKEESLPMVLNVTNCKMITKLYGTGNVLEWAGKKIAIQATTTKMAGSKVGCLRVCDFRPDICCNCGKVIEDDKVIKGSLAKYGAPYCSKECLESIQKGPDILNDDKQQ